MRGHSAQLAHRMTSQILLLVHQHPIHLNQLYQILGLEAPIFKVPRRLDFLIRVETYYTYLICNSHVARYRNLELQT